MSNPNVIIFDEPDAEAAINQTVTENTDESAPAADSTLIEGNDWCQKEEVVASPDVRAAEEVEESYDPAEDRNLMSIVDVDTRNQVIYGKPRTRKAALHRIAKRAFREIGLLEKYAAHVDLDEHHEVAQLLSMNIAKEISHADQDLNIYDIRDRDLMDAIEQTYVEKGDIEGVIDFCHHIESESEEVGIRVSNTSQRAREKRQKYEAKISGTDDFEEMCRPGSRRDKRLGRVAASGDG